MKKGKNRIKKEKKTNFKKNKLKNCARSEKK